MTGKVYIGKRRNARSFLCFVKKTFVSYVKKKLDKTPPYFSKKRHTQILFCGGGAYSSISPPQINNTTFSRHKRTQFTHCVECAAAHQAPTPFCQNRERRSQNYLKKT